LHDGAVHHAWLFIILPTRKSETLKKKEIDQNIAKLPRKIDKKQMKVKNKENCNGTLQL